MLRDGLPRRLLALALALRSAHAASQVPGQDDTIERIFRAIGEGGRYYVEFGFNAASWEGSSGANTEALWRRGWSGLLLDGRNYNASINLHTAFISSTNIVSTLRAHGVPDGFDYLSVDIDSSDVWVLRSLLRDYRPRVATVEFNAVYDMSWPAIAFPDLVTMPLLHGRGSWNRTCYYGSSAKAIFNAATANGYTLVASERFLDMYFVRSDLWGEHAQRIATKSKRTDQPHIGAADTSRYEPRGNGMLEKGESLMERFKADPWNNTYSRAMTVEEAENLVDYDVYVKTGSVCKAREAAATAMRDLANLHYQRIAENNYKLIWGNHHASDRKSTGGSECFKHLRHLKADACSRNDQGMMYGSQLGHPSG